MSVKEHRLSNFLNFDSVGKFDAVISKNVGYFDIFLFRFFISSILCTIFSVPNLYIYNSLS